MEVIWLWSIRNLPVSTKAVVLAALATACLLLVIQPFHIRWRGSARYTMLFLFTHFIEMDTLFIETKPVPRSALTTNVAELYNTSHKLQKNHTLAGFWRISIQHQKLALIHSTSSLTKISGFSRFNNYIFENFSFSEKFVFFIRFPLCFQRTFNSF